MALIGLVVQNRGKVFFQQERPGLNGKIFKIFKFKTMTDARDANGKLLPDCARLTYFGQIVRSLSVDELGSADFSGEQDKLGEDFHESKEEVFGVCNASKVGTK